MGLINRVFIYNNLLIFFAQIRNPIVRIGIRNNLKLNAKSEAFFYITHIRPYIIFTDRNNWRIQSLECFRSFSIEGFECITVSETKTRFYRSKKHSVNSNSHLKEKPNVCFRAEVFLNRYRKSFIKKKYPVTRKYSPNIFIIRLPIFFWVRVDLKVD